MLCLLLGAGLSGLGAERPQHSAAENHAYPVQLRGRLDVSSQAELERRMSTAFAVGMAHPAGVNNCSELLAKGRETVLLQVSGPDAQAQKSTLANCLVFQALRNAAAARLSYLTELKWDENILPVLPPELAVNVSSQSIRAAKAASARGARWVDVDRTVTASAGGPDQILVKGKAFTERLILWGRGDFNRDGNEDLLVQTLETLTEGTYRNTRLFVLTRNSAAGRLSVVKQLL
jgi:hypothetical protein